MRYLLLTVLVILALALAASVSADCGGKCAPYIKLAVTETPRERGSGCGWYGPATPTWSICPTHTPTP